MFEVGPIEWLQGFASPIADGLMAGISELGYTPVYAALVLFLGFVVRLRPALGLLFGMLLAGIATEGLKISVGFPRPEHVFQLQASSPQAPETFDAAGFWSLPSAEARAAVRATPGISYGFPSGHVTAAMAFCLGAALFFRWRLFWVLTLVWPVLMALSRMYLARHFLADVLGGLVLGIVMATGAVGLVRWLDSTGSADESPHRRRLALFCGAVLALAVGALWVPLLDAENVGRLLALAGVFVWLLVKGFPVEAGGFWPRAGRFIVAVLLYVGFSRLADWGLESTGWEDQRLAILAATTLAMGGTLIGAVALGRRLRWYRAA